MFQLLTGYASRILIQSRGTRLLLLGIVVAVLLLSASSHQTSAEPPEVITTIPVGTGPVGIDVNPATNRVYVANVGINSVTVISGTSNSILATIPVGTRPFGVAVNQATNRVYVTNRSDSTLSVIDGVSNGEIDIGGNPGNGMTRVAVGATPAHLAVNAATNRVYVANSASDSVSVIDGATNTEIDTDGTASNGITTRIGVGDNPWAVGVNALTNRIYVTNRNANSVSVIDGATNLVIATIAVQGDPVGVAVNAATSRVYVTNQDSNVMSVINSVTNTVVADIPALGGAPTGVGVNPQTNHVYVTRILSGMVAVIDGSTNAYVDEVSVTTEPNALAVNSKTNRVYVTHSTTNSVSVLAGAAVPPALVTIPNPFTAPYDEFGFAVSALGPNVVVGAPQDAPGGAGAAYLMDGATGAEMLTFVNPDPDPAGPGDGLDNFGHDVATTASGNVIVAAPADDPGELLQAGSVYLFDGTDGSLLLTIPNPDAAPGDQFGKSVAALGNDILVGAYGDSPGGVFEAGSVYLLDGTTGAVLLTIPNPTPQSGDLFGLSVATLGDDILVGALDKPGGITQAGSVYLFDGTTGALLLTIPNPTPAASDFFGYSVASHGGNIVVGAIHDDPGGITDAGSAYVFNGTTGALLLTIPNPAPMINDWFGYEVSAAGENIIVGTPRADPVDAGAVYLFDGLNGALETTIVNPAPNPGDYFGHSAAAGPGTVIVGAPRESLGASNKGAVYVFAGGAIPPRTSHLDVTSVPSDVWVKEPGVRLDLDGQDPAGTTGFHTPFVYRFADGTLRMYYDTAGVVPRQMRSATSTDGLVWTKDVGDALLTAPGGREIGHPHILDVGGFYRMYFENVPQVGPGCAGDCFVGSAVSTDGLEWTVEPGGRVAGALDPVVLDLPTGGYRMYYRIGGTIGSAYSLDSFNWTVEPGLRIASGAAEFALIRLPDGTVVIYYADDNPPYTAIFSARSTDGLSFASDAGTRLLPGSHPDSDPLDSGRILTTSIVQFPNDVIRMYYQGSSSSNINNPGRVFSAVASGSIVTNTNDSGAGSLRQAILNANAAPNGPEPDVITFGIPGAGPHVIAPSTSLPTITDPVVIDGYTQPGSVENTNGTDSGLNTGLKVVLDGGGVIQHGLHITAGYSTIRGLAINDFTYAGVFVPAGDRNTISGNFIGTDVSGTLDQGNAAAGVYIQDSSHNIVGGLTASDRNLISGNGVGIVLRASSNLNTASLNVIQGNLIGTNATGTGGVPNSPSGVSIDSASNNTIGGAEPAARNIISGNGLGIVISNSQSLNNRVQGNFIGTDVSGAVNLGNVNGGIDLMFAPGATVGGATPGTGNTIAFNGRDGILVRSTSTGQAIYGNSIFANAEQGIDATASSSPNLPSGDGVTLNDEASFPYDTDTGGNRLQNFPVLTSAATVGSVTTINATLRSTAERSYRIDFFSNPSCDAGGYGEGKVYLGSANLVTDSAGLGDVARGGLPNVTPGHVVTATATREDTGDTSEFSLCQTVVTSARVIVNKDFVDNNPAAVNIALACTSGTIAIDDPTATESDPADPADPAEFTIAGFVPGATCTATETVPTGYAADQTNCASVAITISVTSSCTITNSKGVLLIRDIDPFTRPGWPCTANQSALAALSIPYTTISTAQMPSTNLSAYDVVLVAGDQTTSSYTALAANASQLAAFVSGGGVLIAHAVDQGWQAGEWATSWLPGGVHHVHPGANLLTIVDTANPIVAGMPGGGIVGDAELDQWNSSTHGYFTSLPGGSMTIVGITGDTAGKPVYVKYAFGSGQVLASMQTHEYGWCHLPAPTSSAARNMLKNEILYAERLASNPPPLEPAAVKASTASIDDATGGTVPEASAADPVDAEVRIPPNALPGAMTELTVTVSQFSATDPALPPPPEGSLPLVYRFEPEGQTFDQDIEIVLPYDDANDNGFEDVTGTAETLLQVNLLVAGNYTTVPTCTGSAPAAPDPCVLLRDTEGNKITVISRHFSVYAISEPATPTPLDGDGDQIPNNLDNCPTVTNGPTGSAEGQEGQENADGDPFGDACETASCIAVPNYWTTPPDDGDCDGYPSTTMQSGRAPESFIGTVTTQRCAATAAPNDEALPDRWPPDFDDNRLVNLSDVLKLSAPFGSSSPGPPYSVRFDLNGNGQITLGDVLQFSAFFGKTCTP